MNQQDDVNSRVVAANIALHSSLSEQYESCEPHFRSENVDKVEERLRKVLNGGKVGAMLDLGCGTGFMINIGRKYCREIWGVDVTKAMTDKIDRSGNVEIVIKNEDTSCVELPRDYFDIATAYSFLHHLYQIKPTLLNAYRALKPGGKLYVDLDPNYYFWEKVHGLERGGQYDAIVQREIEAVVHKDEDIEARFGVSKEVFNHAEFGKNIKGGFREEEILAILREVGFGNVEFFYYWFVGQGALVNDGSRASSRNFEDAEVINTLLQKALPLSRPLFKYVGFVASK